MAFSMAGLASTMQGVDMAARQQEAEAEAKQNAALNKIKYDRAVRDDAMNKQREGYGDDPNSEGLGSATAKAQTNGARLMDSVLGLFGAKTPGAATAPQPAAVGMNAVPSYGAAAPANQPAQSTALPKAAMPAIGAPEFTGVGAPIQPQQPAAEPKVATPFSDLRRQRAEAYIKAHPNDAKGYAGMIAEADSLYKLESDHRVQVFNKKHSDAARNAAKTRDAKYFVENYNEDLPNGDKVDHVINPDGSYSIIGKDDRKERVNVDKANPIGLKGFEAFQWYHSQLNHPEKLIEVFDKQGEKRFETDQKIRQEGAKIDAEIKQGEVSGAYALNRAHVKQINNTIQNGNIEHAEKRKIQVLTDAVAKTTEGSPEEKVALRALQLASGKYGQPKNARYSQNIADGMISILDNQTGVNSVTDPHEAVKKPEPTTIKPSPADFLKQHPEHADQYDAKYGAGSAAKVLGAAKQPAPAQPAPVPQQDQVRFNYATKSAARGLREIQAEIDSLPQLASYVRPDVKAAQAAKYQALIQERDNATGLRSVGAKSSPGFGNAFRNGVQ